MATLILDLETEIKPYLDANDASADDEAFLEQMEANMIGLIEADANWRFVEGDPLEEFVVEGRGGSRLWLPLRPITLSSVYVRYSLASDWEEVTSTQYEMSSSLLFLRRIDGVEWPEGEGLVKLTGTWGYEADEVPGDVKQLLLEMMNWMYRKGRKTFGENQTFAQLRRETNYDTILRKYRNPAYG